MIQAVTRSYIKLKENIKLAPLLSKTNSTTIFDRMIDFSMHDLPKDPKYRFRFKFLLEGASGITRSWLASYCATPIEELAKNIAEIIKRLIVD